MDHLHSHMHDPQGPPSMGAQEVSASLRTPQHLGVMTCSEGSDQRTAFARASRLARDKDPVLASMCKLLTSLLRVPAAGEGPEQPGTERGFFTPGRIRAYKTGC